MVRLTALQLSSVPDTETNIATIDNLLAKLCPQVGQGQPHLVVLPESCLYFGGKEFAQLTIAKSDVSDKLHSAMAELAKRYQVYLIAGTIPKAASTADKFTASSTCFSPSGHVLTEYQKMHLFDVQVADNSKNYQESKFALAGKKDIVVELPFANIGMTVCYDLRFPELFRQLRHKGADIIVVPSAFTRVTGQAHWQVLLQARAIENQVYIVAPAQEGVHENGRETWGHSMIIDPWGRILDCCQYGVGWASAIFDQALLDKIRTEMPIESHNQFNVINKNQTSRH